MSLSTITLSGTLKKDPEKRFTPTSIPVTNLLLEVVYIPRLRDAAKKDANLSTQLVRVNAWRDLADECERKLKAGDKVLIIGKAQVNAYTTNEGKKKREIEVDASSVVHLDDIMSLQLPQSQSENEDLKNHQTSILEEATISTGEIPF